MVPSSHKGYHRIADPNCDGVVFSSGRHVENLTNASSFGTATQQLSDWNQYPAPLVELYDYTSADATDEEAFPCQLGLTAAYVPAGQDFAITYQTNYANSMWTPHQHRLAYLPLNSCERADTGTSGTIPPEETTITSNCDCAEMTVLHQISLSLNITLGTATQVTICPVINGVEDTSLATSFTTSGAQTFTAQLNSGNLTSAGDSQTNSVGFNVKATGGNAEVEVTDGDICTTATKV